MTIEELKERDLIIFECISGSKAYGLDTPQSDTDIRGVFVLPKEDYYGLNYIEQVNNESNDIVYYELKRFSELLVKNNPNILELLNIPDDCILQKHPLFASFQSEDYLSKLCRHTFAGYAMTQVKKAKGLKKKIVNPLPKERKSVLDFCYVVEGQGAIPVKEFLDKKSLDAHLCGLSKIAHMHELYGLYYSEDQSFKGIIQSEKANDISLSSISKGLEPVAIMSFNKSGYSKYCKEYREYWEWVEKRNDERYKNTLSHGKNYDAKNMMHTFRLLDMAHEIGETGKIVVRRPNRDFLLRIKAGEFAYNELVKMAEARIEVMEDIYEKSNLPETPDFNKANKTLIEIREKLYT